MIQQNDRNYEFPIVSMNKKEYMAISAWIEKNRNLFEEESNDIYIFGAGIRGNMMLLLIENAGLKIRGFIDNSKEKQGGHVAGYAIYALEEIELRNNHVKILISTEDSYDIEAMLEQKGFMKDQNYYVIHNMIYDKYVDDFFCEKEIDYIAFGDCFFTEQDVDDLAGKTMGDVLIQKMGKIKILSLHGMCIPSFYYLMLEQLRLGIRPKAVAFIVNIPFCNSIQTKLPQSQHYELFKRIAEKSEGLSEETLEYIELVKMRSQNINQKAFATQHTRNHEHIDKMLTKSRYMYKFQKDNENVVYAKKMIEMLKKEGIKPVPFIPSLNTYVGEEWFGDDFIKKYSKICEDIKEYLNMDDVKVVDMSFLLKRDDYAGDRVTKFPTADGKNREMELLAEEMRKKKDERKNN